MTLFVLSPNILAHAPVLPQALILPPNSQHAWLLRPCSDMSAAGLSRYAHLADGRLHLVLVRACNALQYLQFLSLIPRLGARPPSVHGRI